MEENKQDDVPEIPGKKKIRPTYKKFDVRHPILGKKNVVASQVSDVPKPDFLDYDDDQAQEGVRHILYGKPVKDTGKYISRDVIVRELSRIAFNDRTPVGFRIGALKQISILLGYEENLPQSEEEKGKFSLDLTVQEVKDLATPEPAKE